MNPEICHGECGSCTQKKECNIEYKKKYLYEPINHGNLKSTDLSDYLVLPFPKEILSQDPVKQKEGKLLLKFMIAVDTLYKKSKPINFQNIAKELHTRVDSIEKILEFLEKRKYINVYGKLRTELIISFSRKVPASESFIYVRNHYCTAFKTLYGTYPLLIGEDSIALKRLSKIFQPEILCRVIDIFLTSNDTFIKSSGYKLRFLTNSANKIVVDLALKKKSFLSDAANSQIFEYMHRKSVDKMDGFDEELIELYELEIIKRGLTKHDLDVFLKESVDENT